MPSVGFSIKVAVFVFSGFVFHVACHDSHEQCFDVESKNICYFMPNVSSVDWDTAWKTCRELDASLPVILSEKGQQVLGDYLSKRFPGQSVWAVGRYVGSNNEWRWLNGKDFSATEKPSCRYNGDSCIHETQAVLTKELRYGSRYPNNTYAFICSFPAVNCTTESERSSSWKGGFLTWTTNHRLPLNKARNECLKGGGDLATFSEDGDLQHLQRISSIMQDADDKGYWIGLHRKWWIWNTTDMQDMKYNLLDDYGDLGKDCLFIDLRSKWSRDKCSANKNVICQTETREVISADTPVTASVKIGLVIVVLTIAITIVILLIFIRKRYCVAVTRPDTRTSVLKSDPVTSPKDTINEYQDNTYATIDLDDDLENLNYENGPNPSTSYTKVEFCDNPSAVYSEPTDFDASETNRSTDVYSDPYINSIVTPVPQNSVGRSSDIYSEVNKPGQQKKSDELTSPPIKIGPQGDIYTLPISHK